MSNQQLFLVILVSILVAIATVQAYQIVRDAAKNSNMDNVNEELALIATAAKGYYMKPDALGGGSKSFEGVTFRNLSFAVTGVTESGRIAETYYGRYVITEDSRGELVIEAHPSRCDGFTAGDVDKKGILDAGSGSGCENPVIATIEPENGFLASLEKGE